MAVEKIPTRILIIEDDNDIQEMLAASFAREGWKLLRAATGEEGLILLRNEGADCVILDIMLPGMDGLKLLRKIRSDERFASLPVILCTARGEETDMVSGLELGADDYVVKPYSPRVLAARVRAALRRMEVSALNETPQSSEAAAPGAAAGNAPAAASVMRHGDLILDIEKHTCFLKGVPLDLLATEFAILAHLMAFPDIVFSRQKLIAAIHGADYPVTDRSVDVQILGLRKKLGEAGGMIETVRGVGYRFSTKWGMHEKSREN